MGETLIECVAARNQTLTRGECIGERQLVVDVLKALRTQPALVCPCPARGSDTQPWRSSSLDGRWRVRIRSTRTCSRARVKSRSASNVGVGTAHPCQRAGNQPAQQLLGALCVVLVTVTARPLGVLLGAITSQRTPAAAAAAAR
jgi:hypothetical protein